MKPFLGKVSLMCGLTMVYCCKISQHSFLSCPVYVLVIGQIVSGVLVGGRILNFSREAKKLLLGIINFSRGSC